MQMLIVALAAALVAVMELGIAVAPAQAGDIPEFCKHRYNMCLSKCQMPNRNCYRACQRQLQDCVIRSR